jgi:hypothetical protein
MATGTLAAIVSAGQLPTGEEKVAIPDHKLFLIPCSSEDEALFVCGFFNSSIASYIVRSYALSTGISTHVLERIPIPNFAAGNAQHESVVAAAKACRSAAVNQQSGEEEEAMLGYAIGTCLGLTKEEVDSLAAALSDLS